MNGLPENPELKDISAYKKKLTWGEVPAIFHMTNSSVSELDGILTHGFESSYKMLFNKNLWNLELLEAYHDPQGNIQVKHKPRISLKHIYDEQNYELHCYPMIGNEKLHSGLSKHPLCPFENWIPESMRMLFRVNSIVSFIIYSFQNGDAADMALIKYAHMRVTNLINILSESFDIVDVVGYNIAEFCQEIDHRNNAQDMSDLYNKSSDQTD